MTGLESATRRSPPGAPESAVGTPHPELFELRGVSKTYGATTALRDVSLATHAGEVIGLIGANGAGKSTLTRVFSGVTLPDAGELLHQGRPVVLGAYGPSGASQRGVRVVYQELSLCTNLDVCENFYLEQHANFREARRWRKAFLRTAEEALEEVFPGAGIDPHVKVGDLSLAHRQMVEIARALSTPGLQLLILDEPTSSLGAAQTGQLMAALARLTARGVSVLFISHRLREIVGVADRIVVMRNGAKVWEGPNENVAESSLVERMTGETLAPSSGQAHHLAEPRSDAVFVRTRELKTDVLSGLNLHLRGGELVGVAGLEGSGQREFLRAIFFAKRRQAGQVEKKGRFAYVTGDRSKEGVFPLWSIFDNMSLVEVTKSPLFARLDLGGLATKVGTWFSKLAIKAKDPSAATVALSGGNQQKVLVARALLADADIIVLDDPTKGVDVGTKRQMYALFREAAEAGKLVIWYSTEDEELESCSRILVFRYGRIVRELAGSDATKQRIVEASFAGEDLLVRKEGVTRQRRAQTSILVPLAAMLAVFLLSGYLQHGVFTSFGVDLLLAGSIPLICSALAQMFVIGLSQIDLGVGAFMGLVSVLCATVLHDRPLLGLAALALVVTAYGAMGALILVRNIPAVIVTMGMSFVWTGVGMILQDSPGGEAPEWLVNAFNFPLPVPESILLVLALGVAAHGFIRSRYGTVLRGFGNNPLAVERSGWSPIRAVAVTYGMASLFAIVGGMAITAAAGASDINSTKSYTLLTVAAVVMGGSELLGGDHLALGNHHRGDHPLPPRRPHRLPSARLQLRDGGAGRDSPGHPRLPLVAKGEDVIAHLQSIRNVEWIWALLGSLVMWLVLGAFARSVSLESLIATSTTAAFLAIVALGQMVVITTGRGAIDLSIPGVITLAAYLATGLGGGSNARLLLVFPLVLAIGAAIGVANALTVLFLRIPPIIATLGMGYIVTTLILIYNPFYRSTYVASFLVHLARDRIFGTVPLILLVALALVGLLTWTFRFTSFGKSLAALGQNLEAARLAGIDTNRVQVIAYVLSGILAAFGGILISARVGGAFLGLGDSVPARDRRRCRRRRHAHHGRPGRPARHPVREPVPRAPGDRHAGGTHAHRRSVRRRRRPHHPRVVPRGPPRGALSGETNL